MQDFKFGIGDNVAIKCSDEHGEVIGVAKYKHGEKQYYVRYKAADGRAVENWWQESALKYYDGLTTLPPPDPEL